MACSNVTCSSWPDLQPNPDVSGIGVIVSFFLSTCFTLGLMIGQLLISPNGQENPLDQALQNAIVPKAFRAEHQLLFRRWTGAIETGILAFSDTQLVTSLAILISGYLQLSCGLSLYHWQTIVHLSFFSTLTHLTSLSSLRNYFRNHAFLAACRACFIGMLLILLSIAFVPTGYLSQIKDRTSDYVYLASSPATCLLRPESRKDLFGRIRVLLEFDYDFTSRRYNTAIVVLSLAYLITSFLIRIIRISTPLSRFFTLWLESVPMDYLQSCYRSAKNATPLQRRRLRRRFVTAWLLLIITFTEALYEVGNSMVWEILWLTAALVWGTLRLVGLRIQTHVPDENRWGFGQTLALILSILPIWCLLNASCYSEQPLATATFCKPRNVTRPSTCRRIKRTPWFRILTILIVGTATVLAVNLLYDLPGAVISDVSFGIDSLQDGAGLTVGLILLKYILALACCSLLLFIFVCICLIVGKEIHRSQGNPSTGGRRRRVANISKHRYIHRGFWWLITFSVLALEVSFIITALIKPGWLMLLIYSQLFSA